MAPQPGRRIFPTVAAIEGGLRPAASPNDAVPVERRVGRVELLQGGLGLGDSRTSTPTSAGRGGIQSNVAGQLPRRGLVEVVGRLVGEVPHPDHLSHPDHLVTVGWSAMLPTRQISKMWWPGPAA
ncbi:hypothetical protein FBY41_0156 [Humibacillus xanthopallidus]|uniref:Uncharacterized protein n=1 Tax=Humibacillus xanthopallidus TaxID=412689 RepID=A0A543HZN8_9MICO|nr:hypothetical protein FBY41_0156 [Humibacillus xanthopallidus]